MSYLWAPLPFVLQSLFKLCSDAISVDRVFNHDFDFHLETVCFPSIKCSKTAYCILRKMRKMRIGCINAQDSLPMRNICARLYFFPCCAIYAQHLLKIVLLSPMRNICARLYLFPQCAIYVQDLRKIVLLSPMRNIFARFARLYLFLQCAIYSQYLRKIVLFSSMRKICARLYFFPQCAIYAQDLHKIVVISPMRNICAKFVQDCT